MTAGKRSCNGGAFTSFWLFFLRFLLPLQSVMSFWFSWPCYRAIDSEAELSEKNMTIRSGNVWCNVGLIKKVTINELSRINPFKEPVKKSSV